MAPFNRVAIENMAGLIQDSQASHETTQTITKPNRELFCEICVFSWLEILRLSENGY